MHWDRLGSISFGASVHPPLLLWSRCMCCSPWEFECHHCIPTTSYTRRVGQNHTFIGIYGVHTVFLAWKSPYILSYTVCIYGSGQPYNLAICAQNPFAPNEVQASVAVSSFPASIFSITCKMLIFAGALQTQRDCGVHTTGLPLSKTQCVLIFAGAVQTQRDRRVHTAVSL
jgi:hypothetical protein